MYDINFKMPTSVNIGVGISSSVTKYITNNPKTLIITDENLHDIGLADKITDSLEADNISFDIYTDIQENPDTEVVNDLASIINNGGYKQLIALGGGSPLDASKAAACLAKSSRPLEDYQWNGYNFESSLPLIAIPTTAGTGSEVTGVAVITSRGAKKGINDKYIFPDVALIDPELMQSLPSYLTAITGMDALTHAIEAYIGINSNEITDQLAKKSISLIGKYLPQAFSNGDDIVSRYYMALASLMAGIAMDQSGLGIVHSLSGPLCGHLHFSHGLANSMMLPYGLEYNIMASEGKIAKIGELLGLEKKGNDREMAYATIELIKRYQKDLELIKPIKDSLFYEVDFDKYGEEAANMFLINNNPRKADKVACKKIFLESFKQYKLSKKIIIRSEIDAFNKYWWYRW